jgi:hypothetical protein
VWVGAAVGVWSLRPPVSLIAVLTVKGYARVVRATPKPNPEDSRSRSLKSYTSSDNKLSVCHPRKSVGTQELSDNLWSPSFNPPLFYFLGLSREPSRINNRMNNKRESQSEPLKSTLMLHFVH